MRLPLLALHISAGIIGLLSGAGNVFVVSMLIMGLCASYLALLKHQMNNVFGGLLTFYLVATAWSTARRRSNETGILDWVGLLFAIAVGAGLLTLGLLVVRGKASPQAGVPIGMYFFMGSVPLLAATGDVRMLVHGGISGRLRLIRHLWRMCFGLFIATGSFFLGQQRVFPEPIRKQIPTGSTRDPALPTHDLLAFVGFVGKAKDWWLLSTQKGTRPSVISCCKSQSPAKSSHNIRSLHSSTQAR